MANNSNINSFNDFWPAYLRAHSSRVSRAFHFAGLIVSAAFVAALLACGMIFFLPLAAVPAFIGAKLGHKLSPRRDRVSGEHPDWAVRADLKMFGLFLTGRLARALSEVERLPSHRALSAS